LRSLPTITELANGTVLTPALFIQAAKREKCKRRRVVLADERIAYKQGQWDKERERLMRSWERGVSMSDTEQEIDELQRRLVAKTREIEALVADEQELGDVKAMESTDYARLRTYVEELIEKWQEAEVDRSRSNPDTPVNRLIADRQEIEEQILALQLR
jgi:hypothetical protein